MLCEMLQWRWSPGRSIRVSTGELRDQGSAGHGRRERADQAEKDEGIEGNAERRTDPQAVVERAFGDAEHQPVDALGHGERRGAGEGDGRGGRHIRQHQRGQHGDDCAVAEAGLHHVTQDEDQATPGGPDHIQVRGGGEGAMDAANILKPALARGELRAIGATTLDEYQKYLEKDKALERRFQKVMVNEPDTQDAISILRGLKEKYETHHKVRIMDEAIIAAVEMSQRYIADRFLPDKAIDLMDEAASKLRLEMDSVPEEVDELNRKIMQLEIEREAIKRENDDKKVQSLGEEIANLSAERDQLKAKWQGEKDLVDAINAESEQIEHYKLEADQAERAGDYGKVAEIRYGKIKESQDKVEQLKAKLEGQQSESRMLKEEVDRKSVV